MKKLISKIFYKTGALNFRFYKWFRNMGDKVNPQELTLTQKNKELWYSINGDSTLRVEYDLNENSIVFDVGGYEGDWAAEISARYNPTIFVFEPVSVYYKKLISRFGKNKKIKNLFYGLAGENKQLTFSILDQSSSAFKEKENYSTRDEGKETVSLKSFTDTCKELNITHIDLLKTNIEGGEYELLEQIIKSGWVSKITNLQIQFHDFVENADERMRAIQSDLKKTHMLTYNYAYVWENWKIK